MAAYTADGVRAAYVSLSQFGLEPRTHTVRNIVVLQGDAPKCEHLGERTRCVMNEFSPKAKASDMEPPRTRSARNARCFFLLIAPLHLPQAARCSEPVNSRVAVCDGVVGWGQQVK